MAVTPDLEGFREAQERLREETYFGEQFTFYGVTVPTYPPGTPTDAETGAAMDPVVEPTSEETPEETVVGTVTFKAINRAGVGGDTEFTAMGQIDNMHVLGIFDIEHRAVLEPMERFTVRGENFQITSAKPDGIAGVERWLVYGRRG